MAEIKMTAARAINMEGEQLMGKSESLLGIKAKLEKMIKEIWDDEEFVIGTFCDVKTEEETRSVIDAIEKGEIVTVEDTICFTLEISQKRKEEHWRDYLAKRKSGFDADEEELLRLLEDVWEDYDFYILVLNAVTTKKTRRELIQFLKSDPDNISSDDVLDYLGVDW